MQVERAVSQPQEGPWHDLPVVGQDEQFRVEGADVRKGVRVTQPFRRQDRADPEFLGNPLDDRVAGPAGLDRPDGPAR